MNWQQLLAPRRLGRPAPTAPASPDAALRTEFFKDWDRIVFSSAFRRLQDKTQVHPLAKTDYVRTRLTHSLEVASVGRSLGMLAGQAILDADARLSGVVQPQDVGAIVAAACLVHDIGNPPFGHAGESAIQAYFDGPGRHWLEGLSEVQRADLTAFEGNAQGLRTVARLQHPDQPGGLQLTLPTLGAFSKYPRASKVGARQREGASGHKFGFMDSERDVFEEIARGLGLVPKPGGKGSRLAWHRHPLAFLVEAADDICYGVIDIEDGAKSGHIGLDELVALHRPFVDGRALDRAMAMRDPQHRAEYLRAVTIGELVHRTSAAFVDHHDDLLAARFDRPILEGIVGAGDFHAFKHVARERLYTERSKAELQVAGFEIIGGLLHTFCDAVEALAGRSRRGRAKAELIARLLPRGEQIAAQKSRYQRLLAVTDFVAGMTDSYAVDMHRRLRGVAL